MLHLSKWFNFPLVLFSFSTILSPSETQAKNVSATLILAQKPTGEDSTQEPIDCEALQPLTTYPKAKSEIGDTCSPKFYKDYGRPIQMAYYGRTELPVNMMKAFTVDDCKSNASHLYCNTEGNQDELSYPLQCNPKTRKCECLHLKQDKINIQTVQPIGTTGCLGILGSFCDEFHRPLLCAYGNVCVNSTCHPLSVLEIVASGHPTSGTTANLISAVLFIFLSVGLN